jgi:hypothetical protein
LNHIFEGKTRLQEVAFCFRRYEAQFQNLAAQSEGNRKMIGKQSLVADVNNAVVDARLKR